MLNFKQTTGIIRTSLKYDANHLCFFIVKSNYQQLKVEKSQYLNSIHQLNYTRYEKTL